MDVRTGSILHTIYRLITACTPNNESTVYDSQACESTVRIIQSVNLQKQYTVLCILTSVTVYKSLRKHLTRLFPENIALPQYLSFTIQVLKYYDCAVHHPRTFLIRAALELFQNELKGESVKCGGGETSELLCNEPCKS